VSEFIETNISNLPRGWNISTIGEIADVTKLAGFEYTQHFKYIDDGEIIALRALNVRDGILDLSNIKRITREVSEKLPRSKLFIGDILFTYIGANIGQFALVDENDKYHLAPNICRIRPNEDFNKYFLYSYFRTDFFQDDLENFSGGSSQQTLPMKNIRLIKVPHPPIQEQNVIVEVLSSFDDKIDLLHRQNKTLEELAQTLFRQWFIEETKGEWEEKPLSKIANFLNGLACQKFPPINDIDKLPVLKIKDLKGGISDSSDWATTDIKPEYIIESGDVIFAWSASLMVKTWDGEKCILNQHLFKVTSENYPKWFYYQWCKYHLDRFIAIAQAHATTMGHIKRKDLDNAMCFVPSNDEMKVMDEQIVPLMEKMENNSKQIKTLENMRDTLLPKLMSGDVRVKM